LADHTPENEDRGQPGLTSAWYCHMQGRGKGNADEKIPSIAELWLASTRPMIWRFSRHVWRKVNPYA
jgi:hypothetical protein